MSENEATPASDVPVEPTNREIFELVGRVERLLISAQANDVDFEARLSVVEEKVDATKTHEKRIHACEQAIVAHAGALGLSQP